MKAYPGGDLLWKGLRDLAAGRSESIEALLVAVGAPSLRMLGFEVPDAGPEASSFPEHRLYLQLASLPECDAHSQYNALLRRLRSFVHAAECDL